MNDTSSRISIFLFISVQTYNEIELMQSIRTFFIWVAFLKQKKLKALEYFFINLYAFLWTREGSLVYNVYNVARHCVDPMSDQCLFLDSYLSIIEKWLPNGKWMIPIDFQATRTKVKSQTCSFSLISVHSIF